MHIANFLWIDAVLVIASVAFLYLIKGRNKNTPLLSISKKEALLEKPFIKLPKKEELLELEKIAKLQGSGIEFDLHVGSWKFISVWKKDTEEENSLFSLLLRVFSANLEIKKDVSIESTHEFSITVSIYFGVISIEFTGDGYLKGEQPFLLFLFNLIKLKFGSSILISKSLKKSLKKEKSFFALIASGENRRWLSARVQGGSLILWLKD